MKIWIFLLVAWTALCLPEGLRGEEFAERSLGWRALGQALAADAIDAVLTPTRDSLRKLHPATLARRGRAPGLTLEESWQAAPLDRPLVIAVHGFYSNRDRANALLELPRQEGLPVGQFEYASNQPIEHSARLLSECLRQVADEQPERRVALLTHSLGGVVARAMLEDPALDPDNVMRLLMIAPPNHGSALASLGLEARPTMETEDCEECAAARWGHAAVARAMGPVAAQLRPESRFLRELNARPRNARVRYSIFLGTQAPLPAKASRLLRGAFGEAERCGRWAPWMDEPLAEQLSDLPELRSGHGDGVVSVASGKLDGVDDVTLLHFHHNEPLWDPDDAEVRRLHCEVLHRLLANPVGSPVPPSFPGPRQDTRAPPRAGASANARPG